MHKNLILLAYQKARKERRKIGDNQPSIKRLAEDIAAEIDYKIGVRSLRDYYKEAREKETTSEDINICQLIIVDSLSRYLNYNGYEDFVIQNGLDKKEEKINDKRPIIIINASGEEALTKNQGITIEAQKNEGGDEKYRNLSFLKFNSRKIIIIINTILLLIANAFICANFLSKNSDRWTVWQKNYYVEVPFDFTRYFNTELITIWIERIFSRINNRYSFS